MTFYYFIFIVDVLEKVDKVGAIRLLFGANEMSFRNFVVVDRIAMIKLNLIVSRSTQSVKILQGSKPRLLPSSRCKFSINWETEAACPVQSTTTNSGCVLRSSKHVVDLTSLGSGDRSLRLDFVNDKDGDY